MFKGRTIRKVKAEGNRKKSVEAKKKARRWQKKYVSRPGKNPKKHVHLADRKNACMAETPPLLV